jgi:superfamily II DNA helicase RecQ
LDERSVYIHLKKHGIHVTISKVRSILEDFTKEVSNAKVSRTIELYRSDKKTYIGYSCICGQVFSRRKDNALRHCQKVGCDVSKLKEIELVKLCCGRYVSEAQITSFFNGAPRIKQQFDYHQARATLLPFLPQREKYDHTYTHMYTPLIIGCGGGDQFVSKIKHDFVSIHSTPSLSRELLLAKIHEQAEIWLLNFAQKNILMVPGNLRAGLQTLEGGEVDEVSQRHTYSMQHDPRSLLPELKKLLSFAYRRGLFASNGFDVRDGFAVAFFLKDLFLEIPPSVASHPFVVEFCLMFAFRVPKDGSAINMVSCDTVSSLFSKVASVLKAAVCSVICSFSEQTCSSSGNLLVKSVRESPVIHILSPMVRQIREMHQRLPKRRKTTLDTSGNITVDQFSFRFDDWSKIVPRTVSLMREAMTHLANGFWWEPVIDPSTHLKVQVDDKTGDISLVGVAPLWNQGPCLPLDELDKFTALLEMSFHGFGGGSARMTELSEPSMFHCLYSNATIYYSLTSLKGFKNSSRRQLKKVERKLPPVITRFFLLFRSLINANVSLFEKSDALLIFPNRQSRSDFGPSHVIRNLFNLDSLPDMTQVRQFWACVSNFVTGGREHNNYLTSSSIGASKMGHSTMTHALAYASERLNDESHFNAYHSAIGDTSHQVLTLQTDTLSLGDIRFAMSLRYPDSISRDGHNYLSLQQKELVEFGYGQGSSKQSHCLGLLSPGEGKSEVYIIPTIARRLAHQKSKTIIHVSPYSFLAGYQFANANAVIKTLGFENSISTSLYTGRDITQGSLPDDISDKETLPSILFLNLDAMYNLFTFYFEHLKSWKDVMDKIVIDEVHTIFSELSFRDKYKVYSRLPVLGIPIVALSGSVPKFVVAKLAKRLCLSVAKDLNDMKVIHGEDIIGNFPKGFRIKFYVAPTYLNKVATFVVRRLCSPPGVGGGATHVFVAEKLDGDHLFSILSSRCNCRFISSHTEREELKNVALSWSKGEIDVLISTSISLVGNENPLCRNVACAGYLFDSMQIVQAFGRLRNYMRSSTGQVFFAVPDALSDYRIVDDQQRFKRLMNEKILSPVDFSLFKATMTSGGVHDWITNASKGRSDCALKILSASFGKQRENCGACPFCRLIPTTNVKVDAERRIEQERKNEQATERVLMKLALVCLACKQVECRGIPILEGKGSKLLPVNRACCFSWKNCYQCGVSQHDRKTQCFDKRYLNNIACCECWVFKNIPGAKRHDTTECEVKGRLRRLLSHYFVNFKVASTFQEYVEKIYTSSESFCEFMATVEAKYLTR